MWAGTQTLLSKDGQFRVDFRVFADTLAIYRTIGATAATFRKSTRSFLFVTYDSWTPDPATSVALNVTFFSAPDPFNLTRATRNASAHNGNSHVTSIAFWGWGVSISMDATISGVPDVGTTTIAPNAPSLPVESVSATASVTFPTLEAVSLTGSDSF